MISIREENPEDIAAIDWVNELAFGRRDEAELVNALRRNHKISLSLVAVQDGQIAGHILFSPMSIISEAEVVTPALGVGPVAVLPVIQQSGIGSKLMDTGLDICRASGHRIVYVLGHPSYYPRFGFQPATKFGIRCAYDVPDDAFMALELEQGALRDVKGIAYYEPEFDGV